MLTSFTPLLVLYNTGGTHRVPCQRVLQHYEHNLLFLVGNLGDQLLDLFITSLSLIKCSKVVNGQYAIVVIRSAVPPNL